MKGSMLNQALKTQEKKDEEKRVVDIWSKGIVEKLNAEIQPTPPTLVTVDTLPTKPTPATQKPISPEKDFAKVANSIVRDALPEGLFIGKSKQIYDFLYLMTRGAIVPKRKVRAIKSALMRGAGIGSERTLLKNLAHLKTVGLIKIVEYEGQHAGNEYEVFLPEERQSTPPTSLTSQQSPHAGQKVGTLPSAKNGVSGVGYPIANKDSFETSKTSFKDIENNDDEPFGMMIETLAKVFEKVSGKRPQKKDAEKLNEFAELIAMELEIAAVRTKSISNVPAFLTEHLRRRLLSSSIKSVEGKLKAVKSVKVGKADGAVEEYEAEPLSEESREALLKTMQEYIGKGQQEFVMNQQASYRTEDWDWLMKQLEKQ